MASIQEEIWRGKGVGPDDVTAIDDQKKQERVIIFAKNEKVVPCRDVGLDIEDTCRVIIPAEMSVEEYVSFELSEAYGAGLVPSKTLDEVLFAMMVRSGLVSAKEIILHGKSNR